MMASQLRERGTTTATVYQDSILESIVKPLNRGQWRSPEFLKGGGDPGSEVHHSRIMFQYAAQHILLILSIFGNKKCCQVIYSQFSLAILQNDHQARRRFVKWAQNEIAVVPDFHKGILFSDEAHFWLNGYVNKQNCRIWSEANPQVYVETPLHPEKLTVWCALWAGGILFQKR
ncbi:hypothetical protein TNCV_2284091 [Trichonephila clavipes]|nr:hypothetical protein TNCV_2284091 [Trichonephila clavipes]